MTREETQDLMMLIQSTYPNYSVPNKTYAIDTWNIVLKEYDYKSVKAALYIYSSTNSSGFAPSPGQIIDCMHTISDNTLLSETEAWQMVRRAISNGNYIEEYSNFPIEVQRAVGSPFQLQLWGRDENFSEAVVSSNFMRVYRNELKRKREYDRLPNQAKVLIDKISPKMPQICKNEPQVREISKNDFKCQNVGKSEATESNNALARIEEMKKRIKGI